MSVCHFCMQLTANVFHSCSSKFNATSASASLTSGVLALLLEVK